MSHKSDRSSLSQPLRVETEEHSVQSNGSNYYEEDKENYNNGIAADDTESLGPLPPKWEKAYTESGEVYFIDHSTGTSHWLDPRLSKFQKKSLEDCMDDELPYGWEKITDPHYGTYFIDHVNRRTQYENPVIQAKRAASESLAHRISRTSFTKDPAELCGQRYRTSLVKSSRGLGFTIVGGDDGVDEFLQIKSVVPNGPAWLDGQLQTGDVIVYVNDTCVLGYTHNQIVHLFQSISVGSTVALELCRGYPLPFDPNDPNTEVVTTIAVDSQLQMLSGGKRMGNLDTNYNFLDGDDVSREEGNMLDGSDDIDDLLKGINNLTLGKVEVRVSIVKGNLGFGFTIADSACGQRVKKILDRQRCKNLMEGDVLLEINDICLQSMSHDEVVQVLKNCPYNSEATICVQRGCANNKSANIRNKPRKIRLGNKDTNNAYRSKTPTAEIYSTQPREILPTRPKTPLVDTRTHAKTPVKELNAPEAFKREYGGEIYNPDRSYLRLSLIDNAEDDEIDISDANAPKSIGHYDFPPCTDPKLALYNPTPHIYDCACFNCTNQRALMIDSGDMNPEYVVTLHRQETGFGFRIVGGIEDKSQVAVGHIVSGGAADLDGRIRSGDEIMSVDGLSVVKASHRQVVQLMNAAASRGQVNLILRRRLYPPFMYSHPVCVPYEAQTQPKPYPYLGQTYDVIVTRPENEGFGFVIISSVNKVGSTIGRLIEDSPAERCGKLRVGDYIVAVNRIDIMQLGHGDIVNLIKESGLSVTLTIAPNPDL